MVSIYELKLGAEKLEILKALSAEIEKAIASIGKIDNSRLNAIYNDILEKANQVLQDKNFVQELKGKVDAAHKDISEKAATINQKFEQQQALLQSMQKLKAEIEALLKSGVIDDTAEKTTTTYSSKKIGELLKLKTDKADFDDLKNTADGKLGKSETAADSAKLGGVAADKFAQKEDIPQAATETKAGIVKLKNSITGNLSDTAVSENAVKEYVGKSAGLGIGQSWQDVTAQRQIGVTYTNTTGRLIALSVTLQSGGLGGAADIKLSVNGQIVCFQYVGGMNASPAISAFWILQAGDTYSLTAQSSGNLIKCLELR